MNIGLVALVAVVGGLIVAAFVAMIRADAKAVRRAKLEGENINARRRR